MPPQADHEEQWDERTPRVSFLVSFAFHQPTLDLPQNGTRTWIQCNTQPCDPRVHRLGSLVKHPEPPPPPSTLGSPTSIASRRFVFHLGTVVYSLNTHTISLTPRDYPQQLRLSGSRVYCVQIPQAALKILDTWNCMLPTGRRKSALGRLSLDR